MWDESDTVLTREELLVLAAGVREIIKADGTVSEGEAERAAEMARRLGLDERAWSSIWAEAMRTLPNAEAVVKAAARDVRRIEARELVYELLYEVATEGSIVDSEWDLLETIDEMWRFVDSEPKKA